jgi:hypothetical protein
VDRKHGRKLLLIRPQGRPAGRFRNVRVLLHRAPKSAAAATLSPEPPRIARTMFAPGPIIDSARAFLDRAGSHMDAAASA